MIFYLFLFSFDISSETIIICLHLPYGLNLALVILMSDIAEFNKSRAPLFINLDIPDIKHLERCLEIILRKLLETRKYQTQFSKRSPSYEDRRDDAQARPNKKSIDFLCMPCKNYAKKELRNSKK